MIQVSQVFSNGTGIIKLTGSVRGTISGTIPELHISAADSSKYIGATITIDKVIFERDMLVYSATTINGDVEINNDVVLQNRIGYSRTLTVNGNIINNGTIQDNTSSVLSLEVSGNIQNNGTWNPYKTTLLSDVEILNTTTISGILVCNDHALIVNAPNVITLTGNTSDTNILNGTGIINLTGSIRGTISGAIPELHISGDSKYIFADIAINKVIFAGNALVDGTTTIAGDTEIDNDVILQNRIGYSRTLTINGSIINNGTIQNNTSSVLSLRVSGNIENNGLWDNYRTSLIWEPVVYSCEFDISDDKNIWTNPPITLVTNTYDITNLLDDTKYWRVRADLGGLFTPWSEVKTINGYLGVNQPPTLSSLSQSKSDGETILEESKTTSDNTVIFSAQISDSDGDQVELQVELRFESEAFTGEDDGGILKSGFVSAGSNAIVTANNLANGEYHWRVRVLDEHGEASAWQEFGEVGNVDFKVKAVPLYTQVRSDYPSDEETDRWDSEYYANGERQHYNCGRTIADCGCAITSSVMMLRYYGITENVNEENVDPNTINTWLKEERDYKDRDMRGYDRNGQVVWAEVDTYAINQDTKSRRTTFRGIHNIGEQFSAEYVAELLDKDLAKNVPVITYNDAAGHFFLTTEKLDSTYRLNDPFWYNTKTLDEEITAEDRLLPYNNYKRDYNNHYDGIRRFAYLETDPVALHYIYIAIASPAELLITAPDGKKLGFDPVNDISYYEIEGGSYSAEGIGNPETGDSPIHKTKSIWIPTPLDGEYEIKVIGTGEGKYTLYSSMTDQTGDNKSDIFVGNTYPDLETEYDLDYSSEDIEEAEISSQDTEAPTTTIALLGEEGENDWYVSDVEVSFSAEDDEGGTGVYQTEYSLDAGETWQVYTEALNFSEEGSYTISYRFEDFVGNVEEAQIQIIKIDKTLSTIEFIFPQEGDQFLHGELIEIEYAANDEYSGVASSAIKLNGEILATVTIDSFYSALGTNILTITVEDQAGNVATGEISFEIMADIDSTIVDVERAYIEGMITREQVKLKLIKELEQIKEYIERYGQKEYRKESRFEERLSQCVESENPEKCEENALRLRNRNIFRLNKHHQKIVIKMYENILKHLELYYTKEWINKEGYGILKADIEWLIEDIKED